MKTQQTHTPTPWEYAHIDGFPGYRIIQSGRPLYDPLATLQGSSAEDDAAFIVRAVNSHEELLEIAYTALPFIEDLIDMGPTRHEYKTSSLITFKKSILKAIAKAKEAIC